MLNKMRDEAGKMGANGVLLAAIDEPGTGAKIAGAVLGVGVNRKGQVIAILVGNDTIGSVEAMQQKQKEARESMPAERTCSNPDEAMKSTLYRVTQDKTPIVNTSAVRAETLGILNKGDYVLRVDSFGKFEKVCFNENNGYGWINKAHLAPG